jgi:hypothetical protein
MEEISNPFSAFCPTKPLALPEYGGVMVSEIIPNGATYTTVEI